MKLGRVTNNDPVERLSIGVHASVNSLVKHYQEFYKQNTGDEISPSYLIESILKQFFESDKDFTRHVDAVKKAGVTNDGTK